MIRSLEDIRSTLMEVADEMGASNWSNEYVPERTELMRAAARLGAHLIYLKYEAKQKGIDWEVFIWPEDDPPF